MIPEGFVVGIGGVALLVPPVAEVPHHLAVPVAVVESAVAVAAKQYGPFAAMAGVAGRAFTVTDMSCVLLHWLAVVSVSVPK